MTFPLTLINSWICCNEWQVKRWITCKQIYNSNTHTYTPYISHSHKNTYTHTFRLDTYYNVSLGAGKLCEEMRRSQCLLINMFTWTSPYQHCLGEANTKPQTKASPPTQHTPSPPKQHTTTLLHHNTQAHGERKTTWIAPDTFCNGKKNVTQGCKDEMGYQ